MTISVCVGSSCHLKGSYDIVELLKEYLKENNLSDKVTLKAAFCLGRCTSGVTISVDDQIVTGLSKDNFKEMADKYILSRAKELGL